MTLLTFLLFFGFVMFRGEDMFKPFVFLKKQIDNYVYGYNTSIINTDNIYNKKNIETIDDAYEIIKKDFSSQSWKCFSSPELSILEYELMDNYNIASVTFCDISYNEATKISNVIKRIYECLLFGRYFGIGKQEDIFFAQLFGNAYHSFAILLHITRIEAGYLLDKFLSMFAFRSRRLIRTFGYPALRSHAHTEKLIQIIRINA